MHHFRFCTRTFFLSTSLPPSLPGFSSLRASLGGSFRPFRRTNLPCLSSRTLIPDCAFLCSDSVPFVPALPDTQPASLPASPLSFSGLQLHPGFPKLHPTILLSVPLSLPLLTAHSTLSTRFLLCPTCFLAFAPPQVVGSLFARLVLFSVSGLPRFPGSHFLFPSAFASVRTSSARPAFYFGPFLFPIRFRSPSGTLNLPLSLPASHLFAFRPFFKARFAFPAASLSLASADDFLSLPFPSGTRQHFLTFCFFKQNALPSPCFQALFVLSPTFFKVFGALFPKHDTQYTIPAYVCQAIF